MANFKNPKVRTTAATPATTEAERQEMLQRISSNRVETEPVSGPEPEERFEAEEPTRPSFLQRLKREFTTPVAAASALACIILLIIAAWPDGGASNEELAQRIVVLEQSNQDLVQVMRSLVDSNAEMAAVMKRLDQNNIEMIQHYNESTTRLLNALDEGSAAQLPQPTKTALADECFMWLWCG